MSFKLSHVLAAMKYTAEIHVVCPKCRVVCVLTKKRKDGWFDDSCWNCGEKFPLIKAKVKRRE